MALQKKNEIDKYRIAKALNHQRRRKATNSAISPAPKKLIFGNFHKTAKTGNIEILLSPSEILTTVCALVKLKP